MKKIELEKERRLLDKDITFFHFRRAKRRINRALNFAKKHNDNFFFFYFLAQYCIIRQRTTDAIRYLDYALKIRQNDGQSYNDKAICLAELGRYKDALDCFNEGIRKAGDYAFLYHNKGWLFNMLGKHKEAILCFKKALEIEPLLAEALYSIADSYLKLQDKLNAEKYFKKALLAVKGKCSFMHRKIKMQLKQLKL